jgi:hypothetical protein
MKLYEVPEAYRQLDLLAQEGEDVSDALLQLDGEVSSKAEAVIYVLRNIDSEADAYAAEIKRLTDRKRVADNNAARIKDYLRRTMEGAGIERIKAGTFSVTLSAGPERIEIDNESLVPEEFVRVKREPSKVALLAHYKETGEVPAGVSITRGTRLVIR